jgi:hypothetical protein
MQNYWNSHIQSVGGQIITTILENCLQCLPEVNICLPHDAVILIHEINECICLPENTHKNVYSSLFIKAPKYKIPKCPYQENELSSLGILTQWNATLSIYNTEWKKIALKNIYFQFTQSLGIGRTNLWWQKSEQCLHGVLWKVVIHWKGGRGPHKVLGIFYVCIWVVIIYTIIIHWTVLLLYLNKNKLRRGKAKNRKFHDPFHEFQDFCVKEERRDGTITRLKIINLDIGSRNLTFTF